MPRYISSKPKVKKRNKTKACQLIGSILISYAIFPATCSYSYQHQPQSDILIHCLIRFFLKSNMIESNHIIKFTFDVKLMVELALKVVYTAALYVLWTRNVTKTSSLNCTAIQSVKMPFEAEHACVERSVGKLQIHFTCEKVLNSQFFHRHVCTCISLLRVASLDKCVNF